MAYVNHRRVRRLFSLAPWLHDRTGVGQQLTSICPGLLIFEQLTVVSLSESKICPRFLHVRIGFIDKPVSASNAGARTLACKIGHTACDAVDGEVTVRQILSVGIGAGQPDELRLELELQFSHCNSFFHTLL